MARDPGYSRWLNRTILGLAYPKREEPRRARGEPSSQWEKSAC